MVFVSDTDDVADHVVYLGTVALDTVRDVLKRKHLFKVTFRGQKNVFITCYV